MNFPIRLFVLTLALFSKDVATAQTPELPFPQYYIQSIPGDAGEKKSLARTKVPFGMFPNGARYQQVYNAALFTNMPPEGAFVSWIFLRPGCGGTQGAVASNMTVRLCTTSRKAGEMSPIFEENLSNDILALRPTGRGGFNGELRGVACLFDVPGPEALDWKLWVRSETPFFYDPRKGNLLMEITFTSLRGSDFPDIDAMPILAEVTSDLSEGMSAVAAGSPTATKAEITTTSGFVSYFLLSPFPKLSVTPTETSIILSWPTEPRPTRLQFKSSPDPSVPWKDYAGTEIIKNDLYARLDLPRSAMTERRYYRLFWNSPQVGLPDSTVEVRPQTETAPANP